MNDFKTKKYIRKFDAVLPKINLSKIKPKSKFSFSFLKRFKKLPEKIKHTTKSMIKDSPQMMNSVKSFSIREYNNFKSYLVSRMSVKEQTFFIKRLSFLIKAGIPMLESLHMLRDQTRKKNYVAMLDSVIHDVSNGQYLSTSLGKYRNMFGDFAINIISFGESTGILSDNLSYLADELKKKNALKKKVLGAFVYPAVVTLATLGITGFLMIYLFPKIMPVFNSLHITLPLSTRMVIFMSNFLINHGLALMLFLILCAIVFLVTLKRLPIFHYYFDKVIMKIPSIGTVVKQYNLANATRTMGILLKSGITLGETLEITTKVSGNLVYKEEFKTMADVVNRGERLSIHLATNRNLFPDVLTQIISVGERSGNLSNSLIYLSDLYENDVEDFTKNISSLVEPVLMIFMGIMVGFIAISIITPIYSITQNLHA